jgi:hypothetical protein
MRVYWHRQVDTDLRSRWLRSHLTSLGSELGAGRPARPPRP